MHVTLLPPEPEAPPTPSLPDEPETPPPLDEMAPPLPNDPEVPPEEIIPPVPDVEMGTQVQHSHGLQPHGSLLHWQSFDGLFW